MNNFYTYELCSSENPYLPFYIGKGKGNRMYDHEKNSLRSAYKNKHLQRKILKLKRNGYQLVYRKIAENVSEQDAFTIEKDMIAFNRELGFKLCNFTNGGEGTTGPKSEKTKRKMSKSKLGKNNPMYGKKPWSYGLTKDTSPSLKRSSEKISIIVKEQYKSGLKNTNGKNNGMYGKPAWNKNKHTKPHTEEWKRQHGDMLRGRKLPPRTEEWKHNLSISCKGKIPWNKGLKYKNKKT
jgi:hypothetical protein